jgi:hypothetical protein
MIEGVSKAGAGHAESYCQSGEALPHPKPANTEAQKTFSN